jgi:hypothetical protein
MLNSVAKVHYSDNFIVLCHGQKPELFKELYYSIVAAFKLLFS